MSTSNVLRFLEKEKFEFRISTLEEWKEKIEHVIDAINELHNFCPMIYEKRCHFGNSSKCYFCEARETCLIYSDIKADLRYFAANLQCIVNAIEKTIKRKKGGGK